MIASGESANGARFVHLHCHSQYSPAVGCCQVEDLVQAAARHRMGAVALTDLGTLKGTRDFYSLAVKAGIKPILGCEILLNRGILMEGWKTPPNYHLTLLARNNQGYANLETMLNSAILQKQNRLPRVDKELLSRHAQGLVCLSGCLAGEIPSHLMHDDNEGARLILTEYLQMFDLGSVCLELMDNGLPLQRKINQGLLTLGQEMGVPVVATNDVQYIDRHFEKEPIAPDSIIPEPLTDLQGLYFKSTQEMFQSLDYAPSAVVMTQIVADLCNVEITRSKRKRQR